MNLFEPWHNFPTQDKKWFLWWNLDQHIHTHANTQRTKNQLEMNFLRCRYKMSKRYIFTINQVEIPQVDNFTFHFGFFFVYFFFKFDNISFGKVIIPIDFILLILFRINVINLIMNTYRKELRWESLCRNFAGQNGT